MNSHKGKYRYGEVYSLCMALDEQPRGPKFCHSMWGFSEIIVLLLIRKHLSFIGKCHLEECVAQREREKEREQERARKQYSGRLPFEVINTFYVI